MALPTGSTFMPGISPSSTSDDDSASNPYTEFRRSVENLNQSESGTAGGGATSVDVIDPDPNENNDAGSDAVVQADSDPLGEVDPSKADPGQTTKSLKKGVKKAVETMRPGDGAKNNTTVDEVIASTTVGTTVTPSTPMPSPVNRAVNKAQKRLQSAVSRVRSLLEENGATALLAAGAVAVAGVAALGSGGGSTS